MKKAEMKAFKTRLLEERARLRNDVKHMVDSALNSGSELSRMPIHLADLGSDLYEQDFTLSLMPAEERTLSLIELALQRIEDGTYGACEGCGQNIAKTRLNAIPYTPYCIRCAQEMERG